MKKAIFAFLMGLVLCAGISFAANESEYYYINVPIEKIYRHRLGYVVMYQKGVVGTARAYIPYDWFTAPAGKADLVYMGPGNVWPYMVVYYKEGEFSHVRLNVRRDSSHVTWSVVPFDVNIDQNFETAEGIRIEF